MRKVICLLEIDSNGEEMWEMVDPDVGICIEYFSTKEYAEKYVKDNSLEITKWVND